jgi:hypothetical protein
MQTIAEPRKEVSIEPGYSPKPKRPRTAILAADSPSPSPSDPVNPPTETTSSMLKRRASK